MAARVRLPARAVSPFAQLPLHVQVSLVGAACAVLLGGAIAVIALSVAGPAASRQAAPPVATLAEAAPAFSTRLGAALSAAQPTIVSLPPPMSISADGTLGMAVEFVPAQVRAGSPLTIRFTLQNRTDAPLPRVRIDASGPWAGYAVTEVTPNGSFARVSDTQATIRSQIDLAANSIGSVSVLVIPNQAGDAQFSFMLRPSEGT